jgi:hypothetical protein
MKIDFRFILYFIICQAIIIFTNMPFLNHRVWGVNQGVVSNYVHGGHVDYYTYLTFIRESKDGSWQIPALFTSEKTNPSFIYVFYILLGKIAKITGATPTAIYHISRFVGIEFFFFTLYFLAEEIIGKKLAVWAVLIGLFSSPPISVFNKPIWDISYAYLWWYNLDVLFRTDYVPHHQFGVSMTLVSLFTFLKYIRSNNKHYLIFSITSAFISAIVFPTPALILVFCIPLALLLTDFSVNINIQKLFKKIMPCLFVAFAVLIGSLIIKNETTKGFPWSQWNSWDIEHWNKFPNFERDFIGAGGWLLILSIPPVIQIFWKRNNIVKMILAIWVILPYILLPFCDMLGLAKIRLGFLANYFPLGLLVVDYYYKIFRKIDLIFLRYLLIVACVSLYIFVSIPITYKFYDDKDRSYSYMGAEMIVTPDIYKAYSYLFANISNHPVVLSDGAIGNMLPAYVPIVSYYGHPVHTYDYYGKMGEVRRFFGGKMLEQEVSQFIDSGRIEYIFWGPGETSMGGDIEKYHIPFFVWYKNDTVKILKRS